MTLESRCEEQLEFPFLNKMRMKMYAKAQRDEMDSLWTVNYRYDGDNGKEMRFGDFIADIWIKGGLAKNFHNNNYHKYFYDAPGYQYTKDTTR